MSAEMFMLLTGMKMLHVPYKGNVPALTDLLGGQVDVLFSPINSALPHIKAASCGRSPWRATSAWPRCPTCRR